MKKFAKLLGSLIILTSLVACQDLGAEIPAADAEKQQAKILEKAEDKAPKVYSLNVSYNVSVKLDLASDTSLLENSVNSNNTGNGKLYSAFNVNKLYAYSSIKTQSSSKSGSSSEKENMISEDWLYFKDGSLYEVSHTKENDKESKVYTTTKMSEDDAKEYFKMSVLQDLYYSYLDLNTFKQMASSVSGQGEVESYVGIGATKIKTEEKYYSKGDGNLSYVMKANGSYSEKTYGSFKYNCSFSTTIDSYSFSKASLSLSLLVKDDKGKENVSMKAGFSASAGRSCSVAYPDLKAYTESK